MTHRERAIHMLKVLHCSTAEPSPSAVLLVERTLERVDAEARIDVMRRLQEMLFSADEDKESA